MRAIPSRTDDGPGCMTSKPTQSTCVARVRFGVAAALLAAAAVAVAACGSSTLSRTSADGPVGAVTSSADGTGGCGDTNLGPVNDPAGVLNKLPAAYAAGYDGYPYTVQRSAWANWRPAKSSGLRVGVILGDTANPAQVKTLDVLKTSLAQDHSITGVSVDISNDNLTTELQEYRTLVAQGVNLIILQPVSTEAEVPAIESAAHRGIPTITVGNQMATSDAVAVTYNWKLAAARQAASVASALGGKGDILEIEGIPGLAINTDALSGFASALKDCPGIHVVGTVVGQFAPPVAKSVTLQFLATHPESIDGVLQVGGAGAAAVGAFQQAGRPLPAINFMGASEGELALWTQLKSKGLKGVAAVDSAVGLGDALARVAERMLAGDGIQPTAVVAPWRIIDPATLESVVQPSWTPQSTADVDVDSDAYFPLGLLNSLFASNGRRS
jgi:ribose transport system substrate-binding protein